MEAAWKTQEDEANASSIWQVGVGCGRVRFMNWRMETEACVSSLRRLREMAEAVGGSLTLESAPEEIKRAFDVWGGDASGSTLMGRIKRQLDPLGLFSPGRFSPDV
jgi:FAD/FMN-containing dehydrogenase